MAARRRGKAAPPADAALHAAPPALLHVGLADLGKADEAVGAWQGLCEFAQRVGANGVLVEPLWRRAADATQGEDPQDGHGDAAPADADTSTTRLGGQAMPTLLADMARTAREYGLALVVEVALDRAARHATAATALPEWLAQPVDEPARDPRQPPTAGQVLTLRAGAVPPAFLQAWHARLASWLDAGVAGFCFDAPQRLPAADWRHLLGGLRGHAAPLLAYAWTHGLAPEHLAGLRGAGFDGVFSSLPWWNFQDDWLLHEAHRLRAVAPLIAPVGVSRGTPHADRRMLWAAALAGDGMLLPARTLLPPREIAAAVSCQRQRPPAGTLYIVGGPPGGATALLRRAGTPLAIADTADLLLINPDAQAPAQVAPGLLAGVLPPGALHIADEAGTPADLPDSLPPGACLRLAVGAPQPVVSTAYTAMRRQAPQRLAIESVAPAVDDGAFPAKTITYRPLAVSADLIFDGHDTLAGEVRWRALDEDTWQVASLVPLGNDRWAASLTPRRVGRHEFAIAAWRDTWASFTYELRKKHEAGVASGLELLDGAALLRAAAARAGKRQPAEAVRTVKAALHALGDLPSPASQGERLAAADLPAATAERVATLLDPALAQAMRLVDDRAFEAVTPAYPLWVDRPQAEFASWYELFPRSQSSEPGRHGTFADVARRLPALREMGFDVLYFPPIHPIGLSHRKGRNNSLIAAPGDVGSPYAIGSAEGGHDAIHGELGNLQDFLALLRDARTHGMDVALDFAIQCSPDHPWLAEHPDWFTRRADGSIRHAENPPKKYEDIVNVAFYAETGKRARQASLWEALRDVVLFWVAHGVRVFRVDNPHTKPLPFWAWLIDSVQDAHPDVLFLSEAFTRPRMMLRLAKVGFTQSYTYFTWRHGKQEIIDYLRELSQPPMADTYRPNLFVNTPDINPYFLQGSGRAGFLIRAALAATTSGLWGMYSGFELCEAAPVPGKEEYLDSEKYEIRQRDWDQPGNLNAQIARLNLIRRQNPALQSHRGFHVAECANPDLLCFWKATPCHGNIVLGIISLDPHRVQQGEMALPRWLAGKGPAGIVAEDLLADGTETWWHDWHGVTLTPDAPYRLWRLTAAAP